MNEPKKKKFIRAEYNENEYRQKFKFIWECLLCGKEYMTRTTADTNGMCPECEKRESQRRMKERQETAEKKMYCKILAKLKKAKFSFADIPSVVINGEKYYQAKALEEAIECMMDGKEIE